MNAALILSLALSPAPTAIVDSVDGSVGLSPLQLLVPGTTVELGRSARLRLAYFASCVHETVRGGRLRVGVVASLAVDGEVERVTADCNPPPTRIGGGAVGALVLRSITTAPAEPAYRLRTTHPMMLGTPGTRFRMTREYPRGHELFVSMLTNTQRLDTLEPDAIYRICVESRCLRVWVDPDARHEHGPILERVVRLP